MKPANETIYTCHIVTGVWLPGKSQLDCTYGYTAMDLAETLVGSGIEIVDATIDCYSQGFGLF